MLLTVIGEDEHELVMSKTSLRVNANNRRFTKGDTLVIHDAISIQTFL